MAMQVKFPFGKLVSVFVTHVEASGDFFVQINNEAGKLDALMAEIEQTVLSGRARAPKAAEIMVGCIYLAQYQGDSRWYRCRVLGVNIAEQQCEVFFVDYGNTDFIPLSCIRNAEEKFCELPQQSFECELEGIDRFRSQGFEETVALLNETIVEQEFYCKAVQLKKNCVLVTQLFFDEKGTKPVFDQMQSGGLSAAADSLMSNGESTLPQQLNRKREVKYKTMNLPPDSFHDLSVTWVEDPSHFWCQLLTNTTTIGALMENLAEVYTNLEPAALPLQSCTVGYPCCAKFYEDDAWYRAVITNVSSIATGRIEVRFVDYGNSQDTELSDVRDLKDEFLKDPCQAMYFAIAGVDPASKDGMWADEAKVLFEKLINLKHVVGLVTSVENDGRHRVKLMDTTSDLDMELNQILIAANYGVKSADTPTTTTSTVTALKSSQPATKTMSQPVFAKENVQVGIEEKVLVTNITNPSKFYCQLFKNGPKLESLMQDLGHHYSRLGANEELLSSPSPGDPCCAQFSEDGCWYRAVVMNSSPKGVTVQYIDYGNSETLPLNKIKKLIPKFSDLPQQGIECTLNRIKPKFVAGEPKWKPRDTETFMHLALEKEGKLTVVTQGNSGVYRVELVVRNRREDQNVSEQLLINGNAELADGALSASENFDSLKSQTFPKPDLKVGHFEDVIVSYTEHPCNFWCQLQKSAPQLDLLMTEIHDLYSSEGQRSAISHPSCGMLCCAQFTEDNKWYRGKITGVKRGGLVEVHFVDYGNYEILPIARVKKLQAEFIKLPPQAVKCALAKISPTNKDLLSDQVMNRFEELTLDKELVMMADKYDEVSGTFAVVLLDTTEGKNLDIASDLQTIMGPCTMREKAQIVKAQIQPGTTERVFVSSATSPAKFFCQLLKTTDSLDELMNEMFEYYEHLSPQQEQLSEPSVGEFCAAKFSLDDGWYRAKVLEVKGNNVSVLYIDYGNSETLSSSRLKVLNSKFQSLTSQAIECSLSSNFKGVSDGKFLELVSEKEFTAKVLNVNSGVAVIDLVSKDTNQSVCDILSKESTPSPPCNITQLQWKTGDTIDVFVPFAESAQKFFCQASAHSSELDDLMNRLEECYSTNSENVSTLKAGSLCVAWYNGWYRAKAEQVQGKDVTVNFIDYGDTATVALDNIRTIKPEFCLLPAQAVQCCLKGFSARQGPEDFKDLVVEQEFKAKITSAKSGSVYEVDLVPRDSSASICQTLSSEVEMSPAPSLNVASIQLKLGDKRDVFIPFVESAQKFFCQVSQNSSDLDDLMTKLEEHYSSDQETVASISVGTFCIARYEDGGWYRAQVTSVQGESIDVFYIDYGDSATLPLSSIRSLKPKFSSLPAQAVKCSLKGYSSNQEPENFKDLVIEQEFSAQVTCVKTNGYEVELASKDGSALFRLSEEMKTTAESTCSVASIQLKPGDKADVFIPFVESAQKFFCQVSQNSSDLDDLMNKLEERYSSDQEIVTSISVGTFCVACYEDGGWYRALVTGIQGESVDVFYIDYGDTATLGLSSIRSLKPKFCSLPAQAVKCSLKGYSSNQGPANFKDLVIEQEFEAQVTSVIAQNTYEVELVSKDGGSSLISETLAKDVETTEEPLCSVPSIQLKPGGKVDVFVPFVESAQKFFCQVSQNSSELDDLMNKLEEHYSSDQETVTSVTVGTFCVAQYEDGGWYRAQVTGIQGESIDVFYIDYGDSATLGLSSIRSLRPAFSSLPAQAMKCHLKGCSMKQQPENFKDLVLEQEFQLQVTGSKQPGAFEVEIFSKEGSKLFGETLPSDAENKEIGSTLPSGINVGSFVQLCPTACVSPRQFHCQVATPEHKEKLSQLMDQLQDYYEAMGDQEHGIANPVVGMNCAALFADDKMWYRGRITKVVGGQFVEVCYIDFGNCETVPVSKVKTMKGEWTQLPAQAIQCSLASVSPVSGATWPDGTVDRFKNLTMQKKLVGKVIKKGSDDTLEIELFDTTDQSVDINIGDLLVKEGLASHGTSKPVSAVKSYAALGKAKLAENEKVYVTAVESPGCFFCQVSGTEEKLTTLMSEISAVYDSLSNEELALNTIIVGEVCCAQFSDDKQWYRAVVEEHTDGALTVRFIDYGNTETLPISRTKILKDAFLAEPPLAVKCGLLGVKPTVGETWPDESGTLFEELTSEKELHAKFSSFTEPFEIQLNDSGMDIGEELVKAKLACSTKTAVEPTAQGKPASGQYTNPVVECGKMYDVVMSHLSSPGKFFCQLVDMKEQLDGLMTDLNDHYFELAETEGCLVSPTVGQSCVALFEEMWYRAEVLKISVNDMTVHYVDYGNEETLKPSGVKQITPLFLKTPKVAIECSLDLNRNDWPKDSTGIFEELTANDEQLIVKIIRCQGGRYEVKVFNNDASCLSAELLSTFEEPAQEVTLKEQALQLGQTEDVYVVHTESPEDFYIQLSAMYPQLEQMMAEIAEVYSGLADDVGHEDVVIGNPVCAQFSEDNSWYRAVIKSVPSDFEVEVHYIDYGNSEVVLMSDVRQLSKRFFNLPVQAVRCSLDSPGVESFGQRVADKELKATFLSLEKGKWKVSLFDGDGKIGQVGVPEDSGDTFLVREFIQPAIAPEMKERVYVSHVVNPDEFYVQFESALDDLSALSGEISRFYLSLGPSTKVLRSPSPGMSCGARFSRDGDWYRGRVKRVTSSGAEVEFVDYGNSEVVSFNQVKDPEKDFMQLPQQAILCGLDATKDHWSPGEVNIFRSVALDKSFNAKFIVRDGQKWRVSLDSGGVSIVDMFMTKNAADLQQEGRQISSVQVQRYTLPQVTSGQIEEVYVSHVTESGDFYIQLSKSSADLELIENLVSEIYDQPGATAEAMDMCFVDSLCCARFSEDFKWYRALVTKVFSDTQVEVLFVDYGNTDSLHVASMKQLKPELLKFPVQAVKCRLEGSKDVWTESDVQQFESKVLERPLHVTFTRQEGTTWFVTIQELDMFTSKARLTTKVRSFSKETLDLNKREEAYFLFADSPDCFWLHLVRTGDALVKLMDQIANEVTDQPLEKSNVKVGVPCLGMYTENDMWHRAQIVDVQDDANATVSYIDYGNSETLPLERLHAISDSHLKLPAQGICCRLAEVQGVDPDKITDYLNEMLVEKVVEFEVQNQHADGSYTVKLFHPGASQSINDQIVGECLGDTSLVEETRLELASPPRLATTQERTTFKLPELQSGSKVLVSFVSAFLPAEMQLLLTERIEEQEQLTESITSMYSALDENELKLNNPEVGMLCCVRFSEKWFRGEIISTSADGTATVKLVDCGTHEKIPISELKLLKDELLQTPVFVLESSLANIYPSSEDGQWSPECSVVLESLCRSKALVAEITQVFGDMVELILNDDSGKEINQSLVDLGYAKACDVQEDFLGEQPSLKWPELQIGQSLDAYLMAAKDLESIQLQLDDPEAGLSRMMEQLSVLYSNLGETEEVVGNPRVGEVCCAQFSEDHDWYRAVVTCVSAAGVEVKFVDYGNIDVALMVKQLREQFLSLPVQCVDCSLHGVVSTSEKKEETAAKLSELCESKKLKAEITDVSGDSVVVNLFYESGETQESVADVLVKLGLAQPWPTVQEEPRRISISEEGKMVYNYPESGDDFIHDVSLISTSSPSEFWCQLVDSSSELRTLSDKIELFYQSLGENDLRFLCLQVGDTCCAQFTDDNKWYRSQVNKVCSDGQVCVRSVDYVKQETLTLDRIKKLDPRFAVLSVQALCCSLAGIEPPHKYYGEDWSSDAVERFQELCQGKDVKIKIKGTVGDVTLVDLLDSTGLSIANQLLLEGLAVEIKSPLTASPVKDVLKKQECSSSELEGEVDKESSDENVFEEALSGIEGVEEKAEIEEAKGVEDEDDDEDEFLDSNDQVIEDIREESAGHECDKGLSQATEEGKQAVKNEEKKQDDESGLQATEEREEQTMEDEGNNKEEGETRLEATDKQEKQTVESDEKKEEECENELQGGNKQAMVSDEKTTGEPEEQAVKEDETKQEGESGLETSEEQEVQTFESDEKQQGENGLQATVEQGEQAVKEDETKQEEGESGLQPSKEQEVQTLESNEKEQGENGLQATEEQGEQAVKEAETKQEGESVLDQTAEEVQREELSEEISSPVSESQLEEVDKEDAKEVTREVEGCESKEQVIHGELKEEETEAQTGKTSDVSKEVECQAEEKVNNEETSETGDSEKTEEEEHEGPKMEEVSEEKEGRIDEQEKEFVEPEDVVTEAISEEDLSAITGGAGETVAATLDDEKSEQERLKESNLEEVVKQTSEVEESAKEFLEELLSDVCGSIDRQQSEYKETSKECDAEDISKSPIAAEQQEDIANSDAACCDDVDDNVLSDEALDKLDKELEAESSDEKELGVNRTGAVVNGTDEEEIHEVVGNGQDTEDQTGISSCLDSKLSVANGSNEVGNDLTIE